MPKRKRKAEVQREDSVGRPSRKSTRKAVNHAKPSHSKRWSETMKHLEPSQRAARQK